MIQFRSIVICVSLIVAATADAQRSLTIRPADHMTCATAVVMTDAQLEISVDRRAAGASLNCFWTKFCFHPPHGVKVGISLMNTTENAGPGDVLAFLMDASHCEGATCPLFDAEDELPPGVIEVEQEFDRDLTLASGEYYLYVQYDNSVTSFDIQISPYLVECDPQPLDCPDCLSTLSPIPGERYRISAWVSKENLSASATTIFQNGSPFVQVECPPGTPLVQDLDASGPIIDGWQLIEGTFIMPEPLPGAGPQEMFVSMGANSGVFYFDDVRILPHDASMKSYVYDPIDLRFVAELDDRHFATFYEYDPEGRLIRVKKETSRGIMTIKETRQNTAKETAP